MINSKTLIDDLPLIERFLKALPSGSGFDAEWLVEIRGNSRQETVLELYTSYHRMDEHGFYTGWIRVHIKVYFERDDFSVSLDPEDELLQDYIEDIIGGILDNVLNK